jgi:signal transduction histidine kinase
MTIPTVPGSDVTDGAGRDGPVDWAEIRPLALFDGLGDDELRDLVSAGHGVRFAAGDQLFREGAPADWWWVLIDGAIDLVRHVGREETLLGRMDLPGRWAGGFRAWDENGVYLATGRAATAGRMLRVPAQALRAWSSRWFPFGTHLIDGLFRTARGFETITRQKEALVALGTLAAGLAHEINNPATAATRTVDAVAEACDLLLAALRRMATAGVSADAYAALDELRREIRPPSGPEELMVVADREESLSEWMQERGVERDWEIAPVLAAAGVEVAWCDRMAAVVGATALEPGLHWVASTVSIAGLLGELKESTGRISALVDTVKTYAQLDRASVQETDVTVGLESTLAMFGHRIPAEVVVVRDYADGLPRIIAAPAELNQVWTHLIANALDAMDGRGTLRLSARPDAAGGVVVDVADSGTGMSAEVRQHAFDPFFTTKEVGQGSGLGLDIVRRIIERHHGDISVDTRPGATVLSIRLPPPTRPA